MNNPNKAALSNGDMDFIPTFSKGIKPEVLTMIDIARGVVAGMISDKYLGRHQNHYEASLRPHVLAVAQKRGFGAFLEVRFPRDGTVKKRGAYKKLDYVLSYGRQAIAIECKAIRPKTRELGKDGVAEDIKKLRRFPENIPQEIRASGWMLIAWDNGQDNRPTKKVEVHFVKQIRNTLKLDGWTLLGDETIIKKRLRTPTLGQAILSSGHVGSYYAWCITVCVVSRF